MNLRFKIIDRDNRAINLTDYKARITFEGTSLSLNNSNEDYAILNTLTVDPDTRSTQIVSTTDFNSRYVSISLETGDYIKLDIPFDNLLEEGDLRIQLYNLSDELIFDRFYKIFGYDLGNNPNLGILENPPFTVKLVTQFDADYTDDYNEDYYGGGEFVVSNFVSYRKPYTNEIWYFDSTNSEGDRVYYAIDELGNEYELGNTNGFFCYDGNLAIKQIITLYRYEIITVGCNTSRILLDGYPISDTSIQRYNGSGILDVANYRTDNIYNPLLRNYIWVPKSNLYYNCNHGDCVVLDNETTSALIIDFSDLAVLNINDEQRYPYTNFTIDYKLIDREGCLEQTKLVNESFEYPYVYQVNDITNFKFITQNTGDYIIAAELILYWEGLSIVKCEEKKDIVGKYWFEVEETDCGELTISNLSFDTITSKVSKMDDSAQFVEIETLSITQLDNEKYLFGEDGVYSFEFTKGDKSYTYVFTNYCGVRKCLEPFIIDLMCKDFGKCQDIAYYDFIGLMTVAYTHFMLVNEEHSLNYAYTVLTPTKLQDLYKIRETLLRLQEYCSKCVEIEVGSTSNCGCNG